MANEVLKKFLDKVSKNNDDFNRLSNIDYFKDVSCWLESGSPILDYKLRTFGFPTGIIEVRGPSQGGKTTLTLHALRNFQKTYPDGIAVILSTERRDNREYALSIGIDVDNLLITKCRSIEDVLNKTKNLIDEGCQFFKEAGIKPKFCFVWDSLGASLSNQERKALEKAIEDEDEDHSKSAMAAAARATKRLLRFLTGEVYDLDMWFFVINHTYGSMQAFGEDKSYGGRGIEFHPTMRLNVSKLSYVKIRDEKLGQISRVKVVKSDFGSYLGEIDLELMLGKGFILSEEELEIALHREILTKEGKKYSFMNGKLTWSSRPELYDLYRADNKILKVLERKIYNEIHKMVGEERQQRIDKRSKVQTDEE